jgi:hypothetical protein
MLTVLNDPTRLNLSAIISSTNSELVLLFVDHITTSLIGYLRLLLRAFCDVTVRRAVVLPYDLPS